jgi:hypothetical protein
LRQITVRGCQEDGDLDTVVVVTQHVADGRDPPPRIAGSSAFRWSGRRRDASEMISKPRFIARMRTQSSDRSRSRFTG